MIAATKQRGATRGQLAHRSQLLLGGIKCIACRKTLGEHTEATWRDCHRRKTIAGKIDQSAPQTGGVLRAGEGGRSGPAARLGKNRPENASALRRGTILPLAALVLTASVACG